ncbi:cupin domain-containing protein [Muricoccus vinaceus]|uniref:Cupin domain-containing protein n=1 Tax=Muricoccus vinaceus TaxID=424704 RepID=A0ABV6IPR7_9PROT
MDMLRHIPAGGGFRKIPRGEGKRFNVAGARFTWKVKNKDSGHSLSMFEMTLEPGDGVPLHSHPYAEIFYVLEGEVDFPRVSDSGNEWVPAGGGETIIVPINGLHAFYNRTFKPARLLSISNQLHQRFFDAVAEADQLAPFANMPFSDAMARIATIAKGFDMHFLPFEPPPMREG